MRLACSQTPATYILPGALQQLADIAPGIDVALTVGDSVWVSDQVDRGLADIGIAGEHPSRPELHSTPLVIDDLVLVAAPETSRPVVKAADIAGATLLLREPGATSRQAIDDLCRRLSARPAKVWEIASNEAILAAARAGLGLAMLCRLTVREDLLTGRLTEMTVDGTEPTLRYISLLRHRNRQPTDAAQHLADNVIAWSAEHLPDCAIRA